MYQEMLLNPLAILIYISGAVFLGGFFLFQKFHKPKPNSKKVESAEEDSEHFIELPSTTQEGQSAKRSGKYRAMVITDDKVYFEKIPDKIGSTYILDMSMPEKGECLLVTKNADGTYQAYDPRDAPIKAGETPWDAYDAAIDWNKDVNPVYANKAGLWEKINTLVMWAFVIGLFFLTIHGIDTLGK